MQSIVEVYQTGQNVAQQDGYTINGEYRPGFYGEYRNFQSAYRINESEYAALVEFRQENKTQSTALDLMRTPRLAKADSYIDGLQWPGLSSTFIETWFFLAGRNFHVNGLGQHARACQLAIEEIKR